MMDGWFKVHRKIEDNVIFSDLILLRLAMICLIDATYKECEIFVGKQVVKLQPGQFVTGRFELHKRFYDGLKGSEKIAPQTLWRRLELLQKVGFLNIKSNNKFSVCTVENWAFYQGSEQQNEQQLNNNGTTNEQQMNNNGTTNEQQLNTKEEREEVKKEKKVKKVVQNTSVTSAIAELENTFETFWTLYPKKDGKAEARKHWLRTKPDPEAVMQGTERYIAYCRAKGTERQYIKKGSNFLIDEAWREDWSILEDRPKTGWNKQLSVFQQLHAEAEADEIEKNRGH